MKKNAATKSIATMDSAATSEETIVQPNPSGNAQTIRSFGVIGSTSITETHCGPNSTETSQETSGRAASGPTTASDTFGSSKEEYNKTRKTKFDYFQMKNIKRIANKSEQERKIKPTAKEVTPTEKTEGLETHRHNGLFTNPQLYSDYQGQKIVVAIKKNILLFNSSFATLNSSQPICPQLMQYICKGMISAKAQVEFFTTNQWSFSLTKKLCFIVFYEPKTQPHYILFIANTVSKTFQVVPNSTNNQSYDKYFSKFLAGTKTDKNECQQSIYENPDSPIDHFDTGVYAVYHILQYIKTSTLEKSPPSEVMRQNLKEKVISSSEDLKNLCLHCGTSDAGDWGQCTSCKRWVHCRYECANQDLKAIKKVTKFNCVICSEFNLN